MGTEIVRESGFDFSADGLIGFVKERYCQRGCPEDPIPVIYINRCNKLILEKANQLKDGIYLGDEPIADKKILIIDDNRAILEFMGNIFSKSKYEVILSETEKDATLKYESFRPDFVITDLHLPEGSCYTLIQSIRRIVLRYNRNPIIILVTAEESKNVETMAIKMGADFFFRKPINYDELFQKLKTISVTT
jgi:PleD family two-component response regulator